MTMTGKLTILLFVPFAAVAALHAAGNSDTVPASTAPVWLTDFEAAKAEARSEERPILLNFTGSDWCPPCKVLKRDVFDSEAFADYASESLVLVEVDFPQRSELPEALQAQNEELAEVYGAIDERGYLRVPTIVIVTSDGSVIGKTGFRRGTPEEYVAHLEGIVGEESFASAR